MVAALSLKEKNQDTINHAIGELQQGRNNATGTVTLTINVATTVVQAPTCSPTSNVFLFQTTANAAAEVGNGTIWVAQSNVAKGQFTITHANSATAGRTFFWLVTGGN